MFPHIYKKQFIQLKTFLEEEHKIKIDVRPFVEDAWYPNLNLIRINQNLKYRERLFTLLHEAGHMIIENNVRSQGILCFNKNVPHNIRSKKSFVHVLNEEILAWNYGKDLVKKMDFYIEENKFEEYMSDCIMSYIRKGLNSVYGKEINANVIWTKYV
tara:strand:- start:488 stop:958 length:471 start_codon:yes stop_codon:yes gene_type:complete